jgi:predicted nucleic acid-binding Zn ribbon protein
LGSDANKLFDHGLSKKNEGRKNIGIRKCEGIKKQTEETHILARKLKTYIIQERSRRATQLRSRLNDRFNPCPFW